MNTPDKKRLESHRIRSLGSVWKIFLPIVIGLTAVMWLFHREFDPEVFASIKFDWRTIGCIMLAWLFMAGRDFGLTWRFRTLTDNQLPWRNALRVDMLCEFTSCVTPSAVGGSAFGMIYLNREGIELGRATTLMMTTLFLDELFFVISIPLVVLLVPYQDLFEFGNKSVAVGLQSVFWVVYTGIFIWTAMLFIGIFVKPQAVRIFLNKIFRLKMLRKWSAQIDELGHNIESTGRKLRKRPPLWWVKTFGATALSWSSRYLVVNALFLGFAPNADQLTVFVRQFVVWVCLMVSPTPGSAGISEWLFTTYYGDLIQSAGIVLVIAIFWRIVGYYIYLAVGACIIPGWLRKRVNIRRRNRRNNIIEN